MQFSGFDVFIHGNWSTANFVTNYLPFILFPILYIGSRFWYRCTPVAPADMDFLSGLKEVEAASYDEPPPRNTVEKFWAWLVCVCSLSLVDRVFIDWLFFRCKSCFLLHFVSSISVKTIYTNVVHLHIAVNTVVLYLYCLSNANDLILYSWPLLWLYAIGHMACLLFTG